MVIRLSYRVRLGDGLPVLHYARTVGRSKGGLALTPLRFGRPEHTPIDTIYEPPRINFSCSSLSTLLMVPFS